METFSKLNINSDRMLKNEELLTLKGGTKHPGGCGGRGCATDSDCCPQNPHCIDLPNWPDLRVCVSP